METEVNVGIVGLLDKSLLLQEVELMETSFNITCFPQDIVIASFIGSGINGNKT